MDWAEHVGGGGGPHAEFHGDLVGFPWQVLDLSATVSAICRICPKTWSALAPAGFGKATLTGRCARPPFDEDFCFVVNGQGDELVHLRSPPLPIWESDSSWGIFRVCSASMMT